MLCQCPFYRLVWHFHPHLISSLQPLHNLPICYPIYTKGPMLCLIAILMFRSYLRARPSSWLIRHKSCTKERKKERKWTCIAPIVSITRPLSGQMWITQSYLQMHHIYLSFVYAFARGRTAANSFTHLSTNILLIPRPTEGRRLSWPGWLTHSGRLTHEVVTRQPQIRRISGKVRQSDRPKSVSTVAT